MDLHWNRRVLTFRNYLKPKVNSETVNDTGQHYKIFHSQKRAQNKVSERVAGTGGFSTGRSQAVPETEL